MNWNPPVADGRLPETGGGFTAGGTTGTTGVTAEGSCTLGDRKRSRCTGEFPMRTRWWWWNILCNVAAHPALGRTRSPSISSSSRARRLGFFAARGVDRLPNNLANVLFMLNSRDKVVQGQLLVTGSYAGSLQ
jgi:hypothetical protein